MRKQQQHILAVVIMAVLPWQNGFSASQSNTYPSFNAQDGRLTIPRVDTSAQAGNFQNVVFQLQPDGAWHLEIYSTAIIAQTSPPIETVELIKTDTRPVQVLLKIKGTFPDGCGGLGQINQRKVDNRFEVMVHAAPVPEGVACTMALVPFEKIIPLDVYDLPAGTYQTSVNGVFTDSFELTQDNKL